GGSRRVPSSLHHRSTAVAAADHSAATASLPGKRVALGLGPAATTYPDGMARSHLTLAALATAAVAGLDAAAAQPIGSGSHGDFEAALVTGADGRHWVIRIPTSERAEAEQSADLVALRALSTGIRSRLPFAVS